MANGNAPYRESVHDEFQRSFDPYTHALTVITEPHRMAHDGFMHHSSYKMGAIANGGTAYLLFRPAAGVFVHMNRVKFNLARGNFDVNLYEAPTVTTYGTPLLRINNTNRNSANTSSMLLFYNGTFSANGDELHKLWVPPTATGVGASVGISDVTLGEEWLPVPATNYLFTLTNNSGASALWSFEMLWYEPDYTK